MSRDFAIALLVIAFIAVWGIVALLASAQIHWLLPVSAIGLCTAGAASLLRRRALRRWWMTNAMLTSYQEHEQKVIHGKSTTIYCYPTAEYQYCVAETLYENDVVAQDIRDVRVHKFNGWGDLIDPATRPWHDWRTGGVLPVYFDPQAPQRAVLLRDMTPRRRSHFVALIAAGIAIALVWLGVLYIR